MTKREKTTDKIEIIIIFTLYIYYYSITFTILLILLPDPFVVEMSGRAVCVYPLPLT